MKYYCQRNYPDIRLGFGNTTIASHGCFITALSMMVEKDPIEVNNILKAAGAFSSDLLLSDKAAQALDLDLLGTSVIPAPWEPSIMEVDMSPAPGKQQHFVVRMHDKIIDPWTGTERPLDTYPPASYRLFKLNNNTMEKTYHIDSKLVKVLRNFDKDFDGDKEKDHEKLAETIDKIQDEWTMMLEDFSKLTASHKTKVKELLEANTTISLQKETIEELEDSINTCQTNIEDMTIGQLIKQIIKIITHAN